MMGRNIILAAAAGMGVAYTALAIIAACDLEGRAYIVSHIVPLIVVVPVACVAILLVGWTCDWTNRSKKTPTEDTDGRHRMYQTWRRHR